MLPLESRVEKTLYALFLSLLLFAFTSKAQITAPDTVCANTPVIFNTPYSAETYAWAFDTVKKNQSIRNASLVVSNGNITTGESTIIRQDGANFYGFHINTNKLLRLDFGTDANSVPTVVNLGNLGALSSVSEDLTIIYDAGTWYGFVAANSRVIRLNFGTSLANTPTATAISLAPTVSYGMQISVLKEGPQWIGFLGTHNGTVIVRLDFGTSLSNTPTFVALPNYGYFSSPGYFALFKQSGNWYMFVANLLNGNLVRYNFGTNLQNNSPTAVNFGNYGNQIKLPRGITFMQHCDTFSCLMVTEADGFYSINFNNNITNTPTITSLGPLGISTYGPQALQSYWYGDSLYMLVSPFNGNSIYRVPIMGLPNGSTYSYTTGQTTHTFTKPGIYNITLYCNQGALTHRATFCKQIVVLPEGGKTSFLDTAICDGLSLTLQSRSMTSSVLWSTGATTPSITVTQSGKYWVSMSTPQCGTATDTTNVILQSTPVVALGNDTNICQGNPVTLQSKNNYSGATYIWSTGAITSSINTTTAGNYWLHVTQNKCTGRDTVTVSVRPIPAISLGNDTAICAGDTLKLSTPIQSSTNYLWNTGANTLPLPITQAGTYWLTATTTYNCKYIDTIHVQVNARPIVVLGNDTDICQNNLLTLQSANTYTGASYLWSTNATTPSIDVSNTNTYWLRVIQNNCAANDSINITVHPMPIITLGNDTAICAGTSLKLSVRFQSGTTYLWNTGIIDTTITINKTGSYWLLGTTMHNCKSIDTIHVQTIPIPIVDLGNDTSICQGVILTLQSSGTPIGASYLWNTSSNTNSITVTQPGTYWLKVDVNGCNNVDSIDVLYKPIPIVNLGPDTFICNNRPITLKSVTPLNGTFRWNTDDNTDSILTERAGTYWLQATDNGCSNVDTIIVASYQKPIVSLSNDTSSCEGGTIMLHADVSEDAIYLWSNGSTTSSINVSEPGTYYLTVSNVCGIDNDSVNVIFTFCHVALPDAFTPNGDGLNDIFRLMGSINAIDKCSLSVYNRWGERVFFTDNKYDGWDGKYKGTPQNTGVFCYMLQYEINGQSYTQKGNITLIQ